MINLIKNELEKIFTKKSLYIILLILFVIIFGTYINERNENVRSELELEIQNVEIQKSNIDTTSNSGLREYLELDTKCDILQDIQERYGNNSWQAYVVLNENDYCAYSYYHDYYLFEKENEYSENNKIEITISVKEAKEKYEEIDRIFRNNIWNEFAEFQNKIYQQQKLTYDKIEDKKVIKELEIKSEKIDIRLRENIPFGYTYLNNAIEEYGRSKYGLYLDELNKKGSYYVEVNHQNNLENMEKSKYIIESKKDIQGKEDDARNSIANTFDTHQLFIVLLIVYFSATIISEEINSGTIRQLLIRPYGRSKILLSKLITLLLMIIFSSVIVLNMVIISNILLKDINTLKIPMAIYNFNTNNLMIMNIGRYLLIQFFAKLPIFLGICLVSFLISTLSENSIIATIIPLGIYIYSIIYGNNVTGGAFETIPPKVFLLTSNWNLSSTLFGKLNADYKIFTIQFQIAMCVLYFITIIIGTFLDFQLKDIKNK